jgi:hypothetical protein
MDLSKLSDDDLLALKSGDLTKVSDQGLIHLKGGQVAPTSDKSMVQKVVQSTAVGMVEPAIGLTQRLGEGRKGLTTAFPLLTGLAATFKPGVDAVANKFNELDAAGETYQVPRFAGNMLAGGLTGSGTPMAVSLGGKMMQGGVLGAMGGVSAPADSPEQANRNALLGASVGAVLPAPIVVAGKVGNWLGNNVIRPTSDLFTKEGPMNIVRKYLSGDQVLGKDGVTATVNAARNVKPLVPNSLPTMAEATADLPLGGSQLSAVQAKIAAGGGDPTSAFSQRLADNIGANEAAKVARSAESKINYAKAFDTSINQIKGDPELARLASNPYFKDAVAEASKLAEAKGLDPKVNLTEFLHDIKLGLDKKLMTQGESSLSAAQYRQVQKVKSELVDWLSRKNPDYDFGRITHAKASEAIKSDLDRRTLALNPLQKTNIGGGVDIADQTRPKMPNLLNRAAMVINFGLRQVGYSIEPKVEHALSEIMLDPKKYAQVMSQLPAKTRLDVDKLLPVVNQLSFATGASQ